MFNDITDKIKKTVTNPAFLVGAGVSLIGAGAVGYLTYKSIKGFDLITAQPRFGMDDDGQIWGTIRTVSLNGNKAFFELPFTPEEAKDLGKKLAEMAKEAKSIESMQAPAAA